MIVPCKYCKPIGMLLSASKFDLINTFLHNHCVLSNDHSLSIAIKSDHHRFSGSDSAGKSFLKNGILNMGSFVIVLIACAMVVCALPIEVQLTSWAMMTEKNISDSIVASSFPTYNASSWLPVIVPCTVMGGLIQNGWYAFLRVWMMKVLFDVSFCTLSQGNNVVS
jgi:hypothetical protein